jgi:hypothetical protein
MCHFLGLVFSACPVVRVLPDWIDSSSGVKVLGNHFGGAANHRHLAHQLAVDRLGVRAHLVSSLGYAALQGPVTQCAA